MEHIVDARLWRKTKPVCQRADVFFNLEGPVELRRQLGARLVVIDTVEC